MSQASKSCPKCNKLSNLVTLKATRIPSSLWDRKDESKKEDWPIYKNNLFWRKWKGTLFREPFGHLDRISEVDDVKKFQLGYWRSWVDSSAPSILQPWVWIPSTPYILLSILISIVNCWKDVEIILYFIAQFLRGEARRPHLLHSYYFVCILT